jgi:hypothetical protein
LNNNKLSKQNNRKVMTDLDENLKVEMTSPSQCMASICWMKAIVHLVLLIIYLISRLHMIN